MYKNLYILVEGNRTPISYTKYRRVKPLLHDLTLILTLQGNIYNMFLCPIQIKISMQVRFLRIMLKSIYRYIFFWIRALSYTRRKLQQNSFILCKIKELSLFYTNNKIKIPINTRRIFHEQFHYLSMQHRRIP